MISACISRCAPRTAPGARGPPQNRTRDGDGRERFRRPFAAAAALVSMVSYRISSFWTSATSARGTYSVGTPTVWLVVERQLALRWSRFFQRAFGRHWDGDETTASVHGRLQEAGGALEALRGHRTVQEIAARHEVHPRGVGFGANPAVASEAPESRGTGRRTSPAWWIPFPIPTEILRNDLGLLRTSAGAHREMAGIDTTP